MIAAISVMDKEDVLDARKMAPGLGEFIEECENFEFDFHFLGDGFDDDVCFAAGFFHGMSGAKLGESAVALVGGKFSAGDGVIKRSANVSVRGQHRAWIA